MATDDSPREEIQAVQLLKAIRRLIRANSLRDDFAACSTYSQIDYSAVMQGVAEPASAVPTLPRIAATRRSKTCIIGSMHQQKDELHSCRQSLQVSKLVDTSGVRADFNCTERKKLAPPGLNYSQQLQTLHKIKKRQLRTPARVEQNISYNLAVNGKAKRSSSDTNEMNQILTNTKRNYASAQTTVKEESGSKSIDSATRRPDIIIPCHTNTVCEFCQLYDDHECQEEKTPITESNSEPKAQQPHISEEKKARKSLNASISPFKSSSRKCSYSPPNTSRLHFLSSATDHFIQRIGSSCSTAEATKRQTLLQSAQHSHEKNRDITFPNSRPREETLRPISDRTKRRKHQFVTMATHKQPVYKLCYTKSVGLSPKPIPPLLSVDLLASTTG